MDKELNYQVLCFLMPMNYLYQTSVWKNRALGPLRNSKLKLNKSGGDQNLQPGNLNSGTTKNISYSDIFPLADLTLHSKQVKIKGSSLVIQTSKNKINREIKVEES